MARITTIVHFEVPGDNVDRFFAFWHDRIQDKVSKQPGLIDGIFHRGIDSDGPFQFINVARWDSADQLEAALQATGEELHQEGVEMGKVFQDLGVKVSQNNYVEAVQYTANSDPNRRNDSPTAPAPCGRRPPRPGGVAGQDGVGDMSDR